MLWVDTSSHSPSCSPPGPSNAHILRIVRQLVGAVAGIAQILTYAQSSKSYLRFAGFWSDTFEKRTWPSSLGPIRRSLLYTDGSVQLGPRQDEIFPILRKVCIQTYRYVIVLHDILSWPRNNSFCSCNFR